MQSPNEITAFFAIGMLLLAAWGFRGSLFVWCPKAGVEWLMRGVVIMSSAILLRLITWDVIVAFWDMSVDDPNLRARWVGNWLNGLWNVALAYSGYALLRGLHLFLPEAERQKYSVWTVAFYPKNPFIARASK